MRPVERAIMMLLQVLCALTVMFQLANAQMRVVTGAADWPPRYGGKVFMNTVPLSAAVGYVDPEDPSPTIDRQLLPAGSLFVYGGINENAMSNNDVWVSTSSGKSWMLVGGKHSHYASSSIDDRLFSASCYDHHTGRAYSVGGTPDGRVVERTTRVTSASDGIHWEIMTDNPGFEYRNRAACVVDIKGNLIVAGGNGDGESFNDVWMSTNLGSSFKLISGSRGAAFGRRSGLSMQSFNSSHLETEIIYVVGGEQTGSNDQRKLTNDVYGSRNGGGSWTQITGRASFPARENAQLTITKTGIMIVSGGLGSGGTALNDIWASLDGGISFGRCCSRCFPGRMDHMAIMDSKDSLFILGGTSGEGPDSFNDVWQGTSFADPEAVAERCDLPMPANGVIGLPCFPTDDNCVIPDPDDPDYQSSTGQSGGGGSSSSKGITIEAILGIVGAIIFSLALLYYIVRRYKTYLEAKRKEREAEMQYLNQGIFSAPTTHTSLIENAYERSDLYQPPQPQPISQPTNHPSDF